MTATTGIAGRLQQALGAGKSRDELVRDLVAEGFPQTTAERFVDIAVRTRSHPRPASVNPPVEPSEQATDVGGRGAMISGSFWLSLGCTVTAVTYLMAAPGGKYTIAYGAMVAGLIAFGRGLRAWWAASQPFPWIGVVIATLVPPMGTATIVGVVSWRQSSQRRARQATEDERLRAARAIQDDQRAAREREAADAARAKRHDERVASNREGLQSEQPMRRCEAALDLGHEGAREAIPDLRAALQRPLESPSVQDCVASALVQLGEIDEPLAFYVRSAKAGTAELVSIGMGGFKEIGPRATDMALPYVAEALSSPRWDVRLLAVEALEAFGPPGEEILRQAANDNDDRVRARAKNALAALRH